MARGVAAGGHFDCCDGEAVTGLWRVEKSNTGMCGGDDFNVSGQAASTGSSVTFPELFRLPTEAEKVAWRMREQGRLDDGAIAKVLGISRETVNRRISRFHKKVGAIRRLCGGDACTLLARIMAGTVVSAGNNHSPRAA